MIHKKAEESWTNADENNLAGQFPLHHACRDGNSEELRRLLTELQNNVSNAEILIAEDPYYNWTAGHFAAYFGNLDCLRLLMQAGSVYNSSRASSGLSPLPCPLTVLSSRCRQSLLQVAAFANHPQCVQWLLQAALGLDSQDVNGETALHKACRSGSWECAQLLVASRANTIVHNDNGLAPAELAASCGHGRLADQLAGLGGGSKTLNGVKNGLNGNTNGMQITNGTSNSNGTSHNKDFPALTPTTSSPSVNHLVSSNGYYGYHQSHPPQTPSTSTTSTVSEPSSVHTLSHDMEMDESLPVASTSSSGFEGVNLLTDASVSQDLVPVAGKKRVREDDHLQQSKRGRFQVEEERRLLPKDSPEGALEGAPREPFQNITNHSSGGITFLPRLPHSIDKFLTNPFITSSSIHAHLHPPFTPVTNHQPITAPLIPPSVTLQFNSTPNTYNRANSLSSSCVNSVTDGRTSRAKRHDVNARAYDCVNRSSAKVIPLLSTDGIPHQHAAGICPSSCFLKVSSASGDVLAASNSVRPESLMLSPKRMKWFPRHKSTLLDNVDVSETRLATNPERLFNSAKLYHRQLPTMPDNFSDLADRFTVGRVDRFTVDTTDRFTVDTTNKVTLPSSIGPVSPTGWIGSSASVEDAFHGTTASHREDISMMFFAIHGCEMYIEERDWDRH